MVCSIILLICNERESLNQRLKVDLLFEDGARFQLHTSAIVEIPCSFDTRNI